VKESSEKIANMQEEDIAISSKRKLVVNERLEKLARFK
jgi:hypothetical protein